jgi:hypothetical protein
LNDAFSLWLVHLLSVGAIGSHFDDLFACAHGSLRSMVLAPVLAALRMRHCPGVHFLNTGGVKLFDRSGTSSSRWFLSGYLDACYLDKSAFPDLSLQCRSLDFVCCFAGDKDSVPGGLALLVVGCQRKAGDGLVSFVGVPGITAESAQQNLLLDFSALRTLW